MPQDGKRFGGDDSQPACTVDSCNADAFFDELCELHGMQEYYRRNAPAELPPPSSFDPGTPAGNHSREDERRAHAKLGDTVTIHFTGKLEDGTVFDSSVDRTPLEFTLGQQEVFAAFEQAVAGMSPGDRKTLDIPSDGAYGPRNEDLVQTVERTLLPEDLDPEVGLQLHSSGPRHKTLVLTIIEVSEATVRIDANHPLAGRDLTFEIELVGIA